MEEALTRATVPKLLVANWKLNPQIEAEAVRLARASDAKNIVIAPPFPFLVAVGKALKRATLGAQDVFWKLHGAYTGGVSPLMLRALGVRYVIVGHSERRALGETDTMVNKKARAALRAGLAPILCVGEPLAVRRKGLAAAKRFVAHQLRADLRGVSPSSVISHQSSVVAYEPLWAIGTGRAATPADAAEMAEFIKGLLVKSYKLKVSVLYGGSVNVRNAGAFLAEPAIDGALVGGASLQAAEFRKMISINQRS